MNEFFLIRHNLFRNGLRTTLMMISIIVAFLIYGALASVEKVFNASVDFSAADRLVTVNKINFTVSMPYVYADRVRRVEGVRNLTYASWFGGYYQEPRNFVQSFAVDLPTYFEAYPEIILDEQQKQAALNNRTTLVVGRSIADQYGWQVGDVIPLNTTIWQNVDGTYTYTVTIDAIFEADDPKTPTNYALLNYDYFDEARAFNNDMIGWMVINTDSPDVNTQVIEEIDGLFINSSAETETTTEEAFNAAFLEQFGNLRLIITSVVGAAFFTILVIVGTTMVMTIRERTKEVAVMKTIGFGAPRIFRMVVGEAVLLSVAGGLVGLSIAAFLVTGAANSPLGTFLPTLSFDGDTALRAFLLMLALGLATGVIPALNAMRSNIVTALGKG